MSGIRRLDDGTISTLRSALVLHTLPAVLLELVQNSLDADARLIEVSFSLKRWQCRVCDDGTGISALDLKHVGKRYYTSKAASNGSAARLRNLFGYRGEALASIADVSLVSILTRATHHADVDHVILHGGRRVHADRSTAAFRSTTGTAIDIRDLFYKWPVRRKQADSSPSFRQASLSQIHRAISALAVASPHVAFKLEDLDKPEAGADAPSSYSLNLPATFSDIQTFARIYGKIYAENPYLVNSSASEVSVRGFVSSHPAINRHSQLVFINGKPVAHCMLHQKLSSLLSFTGLQQRFLAEHSHHSSPSKKRRTPLQGPHPGDLLFPAFCIHISCPSNAVYFANAPDARLPMFTDERSILALLTRCVQQALDVPLREIPGICKLSLDAGRLAPSKSAIEAVQRLVTRTSTKLDPPSIQVDPALPADEAGTSRWTDPISGKCFVIDNRTGNTRLLHQHPQAIESTSQMENIQHKVVDRRMLKKQQTAPSGGILEADMTVPVGSDRPSWLTSALHQWDNPTWAIPERPIPSAEILPKKRAPCCTRPFDRWGVADESDHGAVSKTGLAGLRFLQQIDRKFLLCRSAASSVSISAPEDPYRQLLLVDQHAADERVRIERFLRTLATQYDSGQIEPVALSEPRHILLTANEVLQAYAHCDQLARWGLTLAEATADKGLLSGSGGSDMDAAQLSITTLPAVVADRLSSDAALLTRLARSYIQRAITLAEELPNTAQAKEWVSMVRPMPPILLDLTVSRACRGAIMFNDALDRLQSETLLIALSQCDFPLTCAHGRPSVIALDDQAARPDRHRHRSIDWSAFGRTVQSV